MNCINCNKNKIGSETKPFASAFSNEMSHETETQSRLSKGHLSIHCSEESITQNGHQAHGQEVTNLSPSDKAAYFVGGLDEHNVCNSECDHTKDLSKIRKPQRVSVFLDIINNKKLSLYKFDASGATDCKNSAENFQSAKFSSKDREPATSSCHKVEQLKRLSAEVLQDFNSQNLDLKNELVNNYLKTCSSTSFYMPPAYSCKHSKGRLDAVLVKQHQKLEQEMKSISVSTESDPSLKSTCLQTSEQNVVGKLNLQDYFIMQAMDVTTPATQVVNFTSDKSQNLPIVDLRMQKLCEILKEDVRINGFTEKLYLTKIPTPIPAKHQEEKCVARINSNEEDNNRVLLDRLSNAYRAYYNHTLPYVPPETNLHTLSKPCPTQQEPPSPQFQRLPCSKAMAQKLLKQTDFSDFKAVPANLLHIPRSPILCPESTCQRLIFVSDFCKHLVVDHSHLPIERISPFQCKNFFLNARLFKNDASKCHLLYLMCDKITGLGSTEYKDFLPILVMTARISLRQICDLRNEDTSAPDYFLIWVTGIAPEELPITVSLTVWSQAGRAPGCHIVYSGHMYPIRNSQCPLNVWRSGKALMLSSQEIAALTKSGNEMLNLQLSVH